MVKSAEIQSPTNDERTMVHVLSSFLPDAKQENVEALINFIRTSSPSELCSVKVTKRNVVIPKNETVVVTCPVNTGPVESRLPVMFEPDIDHESPWPPGLVIPEKLVNIKGGASLRVGIQMENNTEHDVILKNRTVVGKLHLVKSMTPLEVRKRADDGGSVDGVSLPDETLERE